MVVLFNFEHIKAEKFTLNSSTKNSDIQIVNEYPNSWTNAANKRERYPLFNSEMIGTWKIIYNKMDLL